MNLKLNRAFNNYLGTIAELKKKPIDQIPEPPSKRTIINKGDKTKYRRYEFHSN